MTDGLLFVHAFPVDARMWEPQLALADHGWRVIVPQLRGFDDGPDDPPASHVDDYAGDVIDLLDRLHVEQAVIGGLSMGGGQTIAIGLTHTDIFHSLVVMSAGGGGTAAQSYPEFFKQGSALNKKLKLLWIGIGKDDANVANSQSLSENLTQSGITHMFRLTEGRHEWVVWRHHLREVAPLLFK